MAEQKIRYDELFDRQDIDKGLEQLSQSIAEAIAKGYREAEKYRKTIQKTPENTKAGQEALRQQSVAVEKLTQRQRELLEQQTRLNAARAQYRKQIKDTIALEKDEVEDRWKQMKGE